MNRPIKYIKKKWDQKAVTILKLSGLVDEEWYLDNNIDLSGSEVDAIEHYYFYGWREGRNPNSYFDTKWFIKKYSLNSNICPLLFYIKNWKKRALSTSTKFQ